MHLGQRVLVLLSFDDGRTPVASMAMVSDDGGLPVESAWKKINMKYEKALDDTEAKFVTATVVVPSSFIEWTSIGFELLAGCCLVMSGYAKIVHTLRTSCRFRITS